MHCHEHHSHIKMAESGARLHRGLRAASIVLISVLVATLLAFGFPTVIPNRDVLFIAGVIVASRFAGVTAGLCAALLSFLVFNWFFDPTPHVLDFTVAGVVRAVIFGSVSLLVASLERQRRLAIWSLEEANRKLRTYLDEIKVLRGILPICSYCKQIRTEADTWVQMEKYIHEHSEADFSHGVCPDCLRKHFPDIYRRKYGTR
jgi:K+-sensing histidine kinase KdpD